LSKLLPILFLPLALAVSLIGLAPKPEAKILFVGDMLFDRYIRQVAEQKGGDYIFSCIDELLQSADMVVGNLEGPITPYPSVSLGSTPGSPENFIFTFPPETAALLAAHNIRVVNIGNNHTLNFGRAGLEQTKNYLQEAGVAFFGNEEVYRTEVRGVPVAFVNYNEFGEVSAEKVEQMIEREAQDRTVILYAHWGQEYQPASTRIKQLAHSFVDAGASAVFGSHPHIVAEHEVYKERDIYYSLGNFFFDQYWNAEVSRGLAVLLSVRQDGATVTEYPVELLKDGRTCLLLQ
jgi:poly-gamma-glutamate synthesis protein (capsule biosynthesis protein)